MRKLFVMTLVAMFVMAGSAFAADAAAPLKIGVVDMQTVATTSEPALAAKKQMENKYGSEKKDLEDQGQKLRKKAELLKNPKTSEDAKLAFLRSKQDLDQKTRNFMRKVEQDEVKLRQDMVTLVFNATYEVAQRKGYNFVVDVTAGGVLYAEQSMALTQEVLAEVNKLYKEKGDKAKEPMPNGQKTPAAPAAPAAPAGK